ncbi:MULTISPECIES: hypothetical protein [Rhodococcus]|nr:MULTISPECIES: hypothetical protein [Rhodococcus]
MTENAEPDEVQGWSPAPDEDQAGTVLTKDGQWPTGTRTVRI